MAKGAWRRDPEHQMREDHHDPHMRPSVDHLLFQLRKHKALRDHPDAVVFVVKDLVHRFMVRDDQRPELIWEVIQNTMFAFNHLMPSGKKGFEDWTEEQMDNDPNEVTVLPQDHMQRLQELISAAEGVPDTISASTSAEPPVIQYTPHNWDVNFRDDYLKSGIEGVIVRHRGFEYVQGKMRCKCKRFFSTKEEWAKHVRIRLWRFFKNEFAPIPSSDTDRDIHPSEAGQGTDPDGNGHQQVPLPVQLEEPTEA